MIRVGIGYDIHRFAEGRPLVLGGVGIDHPRGLDGHSDADALVHAVMDALLGAAGLPDIGHFFPPGDPAFKGADSIALLRAVGERVARKGFAVGNVDATVVAEAPRIRPHVGRMKARLAGALGIDPAAVGVKATTNERLGALGRAEGIACLAVALLESRPAAAPDAAASPEGGPRP